MAERKPPRRDEKGRFVARQDDEAAPTDEQGVIDISDTTAPSVGPHTTFRREDPEERLARHEQSDVDAMGLDKRRGVVGQSYGPSFAKQATLYGIALAILAAVVIGFILLANRLDQPPDTIKAKAPWTGTEQAPRPLE